MHGQETTLDASSSSTTVNGGGGVDDSSSSPLTPLTAVGAASTMVDLLGGGGGGAGTLGGSSGCSYCSSDSTSLTTLDCGLHRICAQCYALSLNSSNLTSSQSNQSMINSRKNSDTDSCTSAKLSGGVGCNKHLMNTIGEASASIESSSSVSSTDESNLDERFKKSNALKCKVCSLLVDSGGGHGVVNAATMSPPLSSSPSNLISHFNGQRFGPIDNKLSLPGDDSNTLFNNFRYTFFKPILDINSKPTTK